MGTILNQRSIPSSIQELNTYIWKDWMETEGKEKGTKVKATIGVYSVGNPRSEEYESGIWIYKEQLKIII